MAIKTKGSFAGKSNKLGGGGRFAQMVSKGIPPGVVANIGRKKYGKKKFQAMAKKGRKQSNPAKKASRGYDFAAARKKLGVVNG
jgi:hypothetical protein